MGQIASDMKMGLPLIDEIIKENSGDTVVIDACRYVVDNFLEEINRSNYDDGPISFIPTRLVSLKRTQQKVMLLDSVNEALDGNNQDVKMKLGIVYEILQQKINEEELLIEAENGNGRK